MDATLLDYLKDHKLSGGSGETYSHTSQMLPNTGKYHLQYSDMESFWKFYCDRLWTLGDGMKSGLSEKPNEFMPVLADVDLAFPYEEGKSYESHIYTQYQLMNVVKCYMDILKYCIEDYNPDHMVCFILEKTKPYVSGVRVKNGFHLHFPFLFLSYHEQDIQLIPRVIKQMEELNVFKDVGISHSGKVIDASCTKKHWLMYGGRKDSKLEAYHLTQIVDINLHPISLRDVIKNVKLVDFDDDEIKMEQPECKGYDPKKDWMEYYLPRILSIHPYNRHIYKVRPGVKMIVKDTYKKAKDYKGTIESMPMPQVIELCKKLMSMIATTRADNRDSWIEIGWILYNVSQGCEEGLNMWIEFSRKTSCDNFSETSCVWQWNKMELRGFTLGSLRHYASQDSPEQYRMFVHEETQRRINDSLLGGHVDLAKQLHDSLGTKFVCASIEKHRWYEFKNHKWVTIEKGYSLRQRITTELIPKYNDEVKKCNVPDNPAAQQNQAGREEDEPEEKAPQQGVRRRNGQQAQGAPGQDNATTREEQEGNQARAKKLQAIIKNLKTSGFRDSIMKECYEQFFNPDFLGLLDNNKYLLGFSNGVLDLKLLEFRAGKPDDFISMSTGYDYREYSDEDQDVQEVEMILQKIFPDVVLRKYFMQYCARLLKGGNDAKTFLCATGGGDNGKSVIMELIEKGLGQYMIKFPTSLVTGKKTQSSQASPETARTHGVRFAILQEPDNNDTINAGTLKELTGNDSMYVRGLYSGGGEVKMMLKLALICNKLPRLNAEDQAVWNRTRVLPFEAYFPKNSSEVPPTWEEQMRKKIFYRDDTLGERLDHLKSAFMWIMFRTYKECVQTGWMKDPERVMDATNAYRKNNDVMLQFVSECIKFDPRPGNRMRLDDMFVQFKTWFGMSFNGVKMPSKNDLRDDLTKRWGPMENNAWNGYRLRTVEDDVSEGRSRRLGQNDFTDTDEDGETDTDFE